MILKWLHTGSFGSPVGAEGRQKGKSGLWLISWKELFFFSFFLFFKVTGIIFIELLKMFVISVHSSEFSREIEPRGCI